MTNKTRSDILAQVYEYIPQANVTSHNTLTDNLCDLAVEEISLRHNFRVLSASTHKEHAVSAGEYYVDESDFTFTNFKEIRLLMWLKSTTGEYGILKWKPQGSFQKDHPYLDYSGATRGKPTFYTRIGTRYFFNCPFDEGVTARAWYQQVHGNFADDDTSHSFESDDLGFQAIVACVLSELHEALPGLQLSQKAQMAISKKEYWINKLIESDIIKSNEEIEMLENVDRETSEGDISPYSWV